MSATPKASDLFLDRTIRDVPLNQLKAAKDNPRVDLRTTDPARFKSLKESLKRGAFKPLLVIGSSMELVAGHQRLEAYRDLQRETVPVLFLKDLTETQKKEIRIQDNAPFGFWSIPMLRDDIASIPQEDITLLGLDELTLSNLDLTPMFQDGAEELNQAEEWTTMKLKVTKEQEALILQAFDAVKKEADNPRSIAPGMALFKLAYDYLTAHPS
jgi:hypothetical protein